MGALLRSIPLLALLFLAACAQPAERTTIIISDGAPWYFPAVLEVEPGTTVTWDGQMAAVVHPVNSLAGPENYSSGHFTATWQHTFTEPGIYHYFCPIHPYMQGLVGVGMPVPQEMVPYWAQQWPPAVAGQPVPGPAPAEPGVGEVWLDAQFQMVEGKRKPGAVLVVDAGTWAVTRTITDERLNNPHNMWLSDDGNSIIQTNWFDKYVSIIDRYSGLLTKHVYAGESTAHAMTANGKVYVTLQGADGIAILDGTTFAVLENLRTVEGEHGHGMMDEEHRKLGRGPHGNWMSRDGRRMAVAQTEGASLTAWDLVTHKKFFEAGTDPLPLFAGINAEGTRAWTASLLTGKFVAYDLDTGELVKEFIVGKAPVQNVPSPDGRYILSALTGDGATAIINATTFEPIKTLKTGAGAHGVIYGPKRSGGWYAYVSHKFVPWIAVIDLESLDLAGFIALPKETLWGQGILAVYDGFKQDYEGMMSHG
jgi:plastocyanin/DNA-binding beta-propeller fold protein YncE